MNSQSRRSSRTSARILGALLFVCIARPVSAQDWSLWTDKTGVLEERDIVTLEPVRSFEYVSPWNYYSGLGYHSDRLWSLSAYLASGAISVNPADGGHDFLGPTGLSGSSSIRGLDVAPNTGEIWFMASGGRAYSINPSTGIASLAGTFSLVAPWDSIAAFAFDSAGHGFGLGTLVMNPPRAAFYELDFSTFATNFRGWVVMPYAGYFLDAAFLPDGDLVAIYWRYLSQKTPLYRINTQTLVATQILAAPEVGQFTGIAVGPGTVMSSYCTAKTNSLGCVPEISGLGFASAAGTSGFTVTATNVLNQRLGQLTWSVAGATAFPFGGGTMCVAAPRSRTLPVSSSGSPATTADCTGSWSIDMNSHLHANTALPAGTTIHCQWIGRDPGFAPPNRYQLSNGLTFTLRL